VRGLLPGDHTPDGDPRLKIRQAFKENYLMMNIREKDGTDDVQPDAVGRSTTAVRCRGETMEFGLAGLRSSSFHPPSPMRKS